MKRSWLDSRWRRGTCAGDSFVPMTAVTALSDVLEIGDLPVDSWVLRQAPCHDAFYRYFKHILVWRCAYHTQRSATEYS